MGFHGAFEPHRLPRPEAVSVIREPTDQRPLIGAQDMLISEARAAFGMATG